MPRQTRTPSPQSSSGESPKVTQHATPFFDESIINSRISVVYPGTDGHFNLLVTDYDDKSQWHKVESSSSYAYNFLERKKEEAFTDELNLNSYFQERRMLFLGENEFAPQISCMYCRLPAQPRREIISCIRCSGKAHLQCCVKKKRCSETDSRFVCGTCVEKRATGTVATKSTRKTLPEFLDFASLEGFTEEVVEAVCLELYKIQMGETPGKRMARSLTSSSSSKDLRGVKIISGQTFLNEICQGNLSLAMVALQSTAIAGVLQWQYPSGLESNNTKLLKRGLDKDDKSIELLVAVPEIPLFYRSRNLVTAGCCAHSVLGFIAVSGLIKSAEVEEGNKFATILLFAARSTHVRSLEELVGFDPAWSIYDTVKDQTVSDEDLTDRRYFGFITGEKREELGAVYLRGDEEITRENFNSKRFLFYFKGCYSYLVSREHMPSPGKLLLGAAMRLLQQLNYAVVVLELALPTAEHLTDHGQGRHTETVIDHGYVRDKGRDQRRMIAKRDWPSWCPRTGDKVLACTANVAAYKTYRALGFCEHRAFNVLNLNSHPDYLYPVMGCVIRALPWNCIQEVLRGEVSSLKGIHGWLDASRIKARQLPPVVKNLQASDDNSSWTKNLKAFEEVLDYVKPSQLGMPASNGRVAAPKITSNNITTAKRRRIVSSN
jgi:hypothetical protein